MFTTLPSNQLVDGRYFKLAAWPGPPELTQDPSGVWVSKAWPSSSWEQCVWIDIQNSGSQPGTGAVDKTCNKDGSSRSDANTYPVGGFINFKLTAQEAEQQNEQFERQKSPARAQAGDYSVLVAMHVTTKEIKRWTWQTFWWSANPNDPHAPSSAAVAADRPSQLMGAPRNYAPCTAYSMVSPRQPENGDENEGESVYCFNPWIEAGFGPADLMSSIPGQTTVDGKQVKTANNVGVQTNCMGCHISAGYQVSKHNIRYSGDRYISLDDSECFPFNPQDADASVLQVDFLWSINDNVTGKESGTKVPPAAPCP